MDFGEVIYEYSDEQAIEDGVLVHPYPEKLPGLLVSQAVNSEISMVDDGRSYHEKLWPLLMDVLYEIRAERDRAEAESREMKLPLELEGTVAGYVWIMPNGMPGVSATVLFPEDY